MRLAKVETTNLLPSYSTNLSVDDSRGTQNQNFYHDLNVGPHRIWPHSKQLSPISNEGTLFFQNR